MQNTQGFLSIVMPVYNEEAVIQTVIDDFASIAQQFSTHEYIIVDDGSTDRTPELLREAQKKYPFLSVIRNFKNRGHAPSLLSGLAAARGDFIFCCDSDNQFYADDFWILWVRMMETDADGARGFRPARKDPAHRIFVAALLRIFILLFFRVNIRDSASSFRLYTRAAFSRILLYIPENPFFIFPMMSIAGVLARFCIVEVPVRHLPRETGRTYLHGLHILTTCFKAARELFVFKKRLRAEHVSFHQ